MVVFTRNALTFSLMLMLFFAKSLEAQPGCTVSSATYRFCLQVLQVLFQEHFHQMAHILLLLITEQMV